MMGTCISKILFKCKTMKIESQCCIKRIVIEEHVDNHIEFNKQVIYESKITKPPIIDVPLD
jgi:hypothetical protein